MPDDDGHKDADVPEVVGGEVEVEAVGDDGLWVTFRVISGGKMGAVCADCFLGTGPIVIIRFDRSRTSGKCVAQKVNPSP